MQRVTHRRNYDTKEYCGANRKKSVTQSELACWIINEAPVSKDADVTVLLDPNRNYSTSSHLRAPTKEGTPVITSTLDWPEDEFATLELDVKSEKLALFRRRHVDNLRVKKTIRRYVVATRPADVSKLENCLIVASYIEDPTIELVEGESPICSAHRAKMVERRQNGQEDAQPLAWLCARLHAHNSFGA
ncbi:MAG: hypothetical protein R3E01_01320 [Pirellulaceae bacterium]|nr:hypothetical protein [Planctomycetales bacterium]